jgi:hypothetical protein
MYGYDRFGNHKKQKRKISNDEDFTNSTKELKKNCKSKTESLIWEIENIDELDHNHDSRNPIISLDEVKSRSVEMNFVNAELKAMISKDKQSLQIVLNNNFAIMI